MKTRSPAKRRWAVAATVIAVALPVIGGILWHRAVFGPRSDSWNLGNGLLVAFVCMPIIRVSPFLALLAGVISVPLVRRKGLRLLGLVLIGINAVVFLATVSAWAWDRKAARLVRSHEPLTREQAKWLTPWGWKMESQLNHAVSDKDAEEVRRLVREGADVNSPALRRQWRPAFGDAPLEAAVAMGESNMVRLLVELGADAESGGRNSPVWTVLTKGDTKMLDVMRDADVSLPLEALFFACKQGDKELAAWLIDNGWDVNARLGEKGRTDLERDGAPLHVAVGAGHRNIVELLLAHGADVNDVGEDRKRTPLMIAAQKPDVDMLEFLLAAGADPGIQAKNGWSAMHYAAFRGSVGTLKNLFSRAPELVDVRTRSGETPLWLACIAYSRSNLESIRFLLEHGADRGVANHKGESISEALRKDVKIVSGRGDTESVDRIHATIDLLESSD